MNKKYTDFSIDAILGNSNHELNEPTNQRNDFTKTPVKCENGTYRCHHEGCGKEYGRLDHLKRHVRSHQYPYPYVCPQCKKGFLRNPNLKRHMETHENQRNRAQSSRAIESSMKLVSSTTMSLSTLLSSPIIDQTASSSNSSQQFIPNFNFIKPNSM